MCLISPSPRTGIFATLRAFLPGAKGSGAPSAGCASRHRLALASFTGVLALLTATAGLLAGLAFALLAGSAVPALAAEPCPNEAIRAEQGSAGLALPDCRAYELVTPVEKDNGEPEAVQVGLNAPGLRAIAGMQASVNGDRMAWASEYILPGSPSPGLEYLSTRDAASWSSENVIPPQSVENGLACPFLEGIAAYSADLSKGVLFDGYGQPGSGFESEGLACGHDEPRLAPGELEGFQNLFLRDNENRSYRLLDLTPPGAPAADADGHKFYPAAFLAGSSDLSHVVFEEELPLTPEAGSGDELYEWAGGADHLVSVLPGGAPVTEGRLAGATRNTGLEGGSTFLPVNVAAYRHAVSADGSRVFFTAAGSLYLRENAAASRAEECASPSRACTVQLDEAQSGAVGPGGGGHFMVASADGSRAFFTDENRLTADSTAAAGKPDLYEYDLEKPAGNRLTDLTVDAAEPAAVLGVSGASEDGSDLYFVAEAALTGSQQNSHNAVAQPGRPNLYLAHAGATTFIATLDPADLCDWTSNTGCSGANVPEASGLTARVSANGAFIAFPSIARLTGYDNTDVNTGNPDAEVFLYDSSSDRLDCASCEPGGAPPTAPSIIRYPTNLSLNNNDKSAYPQRNASGNGQVFFETADALLPRDANGVRDVYEYAEGRLHLISSGTDAADSYFLDATPSGNDVFFATTQPLLARDPDTNYDIYDARVGGGFSEPPTSPACDGEGCRGVGTQAPAEGSPATSHFEGPGNRTEKPSLRCKPGLRKHGHCLKKRHSKKRHRRAHRRTTGANRGGAK
jgi:hypothetical protein